MKKILLSCLSVCLISLSLYAQDEGAAVAQDRFNFDKSIYFTGGVALTLGDNLGDYSNGLNFEVGFLKKINKVLFIGPALSYTTYKYDKDKTYPFYYDEAADEFYDLYLEGGDVSLFGLGFTVRLNLIPVGDNTKFTIYGVGTPYLFSATRKEISSSGVYYYWDGDEYIPLDFEVGADDFESFKKETSFTGGINLGFGFELMPSKKFSVFGQAIVSYTMPINYISSQEYTEEAFKNGDYYYYPSNPDDIFYDAAVTLYDEDYPMVKNGFPGLNIRLGVSYNFK